MANETPITVIGNLTADPELRYTQNGLPVANFTVASTPRTLDRQTNEWKDGEALFLRCSAWREMGEHIAGSLTKGMRVIVQGNLKQNNYTDKEGNNRSSIELDVQEIGPSLRYATAQVTRAQQGGGQGGQQAPQQGYAPQGNYGPPQGAPQQQPQQGPPQGAIPQQQAPQQGAFPGAQQAPQQAPQQQGFQPPQQGQWSQPQQGFDGTTF